MGLVRALNRLDDRAGLPRGRVAMRDSMVRGSVWLLVFYYLVAVASVTVALLTDTIAVVPLVLLRPAFQAGYFFNEKCRGEGRRPRWDPQPPADEG